MEPITPLTAGAPTVRLQVADDHVTSALGGVQHILGTAGEDLVGRPLSEVLVAEPGTVPASGVVALRSDPDRFVEVVADRDEPGVLWLTDATHSRARAAEAATRSERFEMVLEGTRLGMWDWNPQTNDVTFDQRWAEMLGHDLAEIPFELDSWSSRVHPDDLEACFADITRHMEGHVAFYENVHRMRHADGHWVHILDRGRIMEWDEEGNPTRFTGTHTDITAQREAEFAAQAANRAKSSFLANMSHEIRTPLNAVLGYAQVLLRDPSLTTDQDRYLSAIRSSGDHLLRLIDDVLTMSKIEAGHVELLPEVVSLGSLVHTAADIVAPGARSLDVRVVGPDHGEAWVETDAGKLRQLVVNLLGNAAKFAESRVELRVDEVTRDGERSITIEVHDDGPGVPEGQEAAIFETFKQTESGMSVGGTGLGLAICKEFAELLGGDVVASRSPLGGAVFRATICAPVAERPAADIRPTTSVGVLAPGAPAPRILVVDDDAVNRDVLSALLRSAGCRVETAIDGDDAFAVATSRSFDLIFSDLRMPGRDGIQLTLDLHARPEGEATPVVIVSASAVEGDRERALRSGVSTFLTKPFVAADVLAQVDELTEAEFVHDERREDHPDVSATQVRSVLTGEETTGLIRGAETGDLDLLESVADAVTTRAPEVGLFLRSLVEAYDHDAILNLLNERAVDHV